MPKHSGRTPGELSEGGDRLDPESVRRILGRAAEEQDRLDSEETGAYTLEELEEIAKEAGISPEAFRAAVTEYRVTSESSAIEPTTPEEEGRRGWLAPLERSMPETWSPATRRTILVAAGVALLSPLLLLPLSAPVAYAVVFVALTVFFLTLIAALLFL